MLTLEKILNGIERRIEDAIDEREYFDKKEDNKQTFLYDGMINGLEYAKEGIKSFLEQQKKENDELTKEVLEAIEKMEESLTEIEKQKMRLHGIAIGLHQKLFELELLDDPEEYTRRKGV